MHNGSLENSEKNENHNNSSNHTNYYNCSWNRRLRSLHLHPKRTRTPPRQHQLQLLLQLPSPTVTPSPSSRCITLPNRIPYSNRKPHSISLAISQLQCLVPVTLKVATTTSLYDTGLEDTPETLKNGTVVKDDLKDAFQAKYPWITVNFMLLGTGAAMLKRTKRRRRHATGSFTFTGTDLP